MTDAGAPDTGDARPRLGVSTCLLGHNVRYDRTHQLDRFLRDTVGAFVDWRPVCPEVECGLGVPREAMRLVGPPASPRLLTRRTGVDHTARMLSWAKEKLDEMEGWGLSGFVFKNRSPSSGLRDVKVYDEEGRVAGKGRGVFAAALVERFPLLPVEDDGRLHDPGLRENFLERVFTARRWHRLLEKDPAPRDLQAFHADHKLAILSHDPAALRSLGPLVAAARPRTLAATLRTYGETLFAALQRKATPAKNLNVLQHVMGYFKKRLSADEKQELAEVFGHYRRGDLPLIVPVTLLNHYVRKFGEPYLERQVYLRPHPLELRLRNHV